MPQVTFRLPDGSTVTAPAETGQSLLHVALDHGVPMEQSCGGQGFCTTCLCQVRSGGVAGRTDCELNMGIRTAPYRLGCQARVDGTDDVAVDVMRA